MPPRSRRSTERREPAALVPTEEPSVGYDFALDLFQIDAISALDAGHSVLVAAPTGSGKTVVAEHAVALALKGGKRAFYTTPIKALSNQKFGDLCRRHGGVNVGLLTGDNAINPDAPIVVMTTEVLRNMIYASTEERRGPLTELGWVVLDEVHYLQDTYRGPVWEEVILHAPPEVRLVCLSATVSNAAELAEWISLVRPATPCDVVIAEKRPVELEHLFLASDRATGRLSMLPTLVDGTPNPEGRRFDAAVVRRTRTSAPTARVRRRFATPSRVEVVDELAERSLVPALYFIFSRAACDDAVRGCVNAGIRLTGPDERDRIRAIASEHIRNLSEGDLDVLEYGKWLTGLEAGIAAHHAGMVPPFKEAVEACFVQGLVKVVFATETLALGVNMPARTVVIEKLSKYNGERHEFLTAGEYTQLTGRAGRRGLDPLGHAVVLWSPFVSFAEVATLASSRSFTLRSAFRPTANMAANLVRRYDEDSAVRLLNRSFAQYQADGSVVRLEHRLLERRADVVRLRAALPLEEAALREYRNAQRAAEAAAAPDAPQRRAIETAISRLAPGAVIAWGSKHGEGRRGFAVVVSVSQRRGGEVRVRALTPDRRLVSVRPEDLTDLPVALASVDLPRPYQPHERTFQQEVLRRLERVRMVERTPRQDRQGRDVDDAEPATAEDERAAPRDGAALWQKVNSHQLHKNPQREGALRVMARIERAEREILEMTRTIDGVADTVSRRFRRLVELLRRWGYLNGWALTDKGELLARCYNECDLLVVEALSAGLFDDLSGPELAAVACCITYEHRSRTAPPQFWLPSATTRERFRQLQQLAERLHGEEERAGLLATRLPDATFAAVAHAWASGGDLDEVLAEEELSGGDFVRNVKQLVDLCRQLGELAPNPATGRAARRAADALFRGVVAVSAVVEGTDGENNDGELSDGASRRIG